MNAYLIISGSFRMDDGSTKQTGETIELTDDVAALHPEKLQRIQVDAIDIVDESL